MRRVFVLGGMLWASVAFAYEPVPVTSFAKPTANRKYVFVMLHSFAGVRGKELREKYDRSGLYPANDSTKPLWLCDWRVERERNVFVSDDGVYAVRVPDGDPGQRHWLLMNDKPVPLKEVGWDKAPALFIYQNGQLARTVAFRDVYDCGRFTDRDCFMGPVVTISAFQDVSGTVTISSEADGQKQTATVAFRTGDGSERGEGSPAASRGEVSAAEGRSWGQIILIGLAVVVACAAVFAGIAFLLVRNRSARREG